MATIGNMENDGARQVNNVLALKMNTEKWIVGPEYDESLFDRLGLVLKGMGFELGKNWSGVAGSQDICHWELSSPFGHLVIEAETYIGLSLEGPRELIQQVRKHFENAPC